MPTNIKRKKTAQRTRAIARKRVNKQKPGRKESTGENTATPRIIAGSLFALNLPNKPAMHVATVQSQEGNNSGKYRYLRYTEDDYEKMYHDILACVQHSIKLVTGEVTKFNPLKEGFDLSQSFELVIRMFKTNVQPKGWEFNIEKDINGNYFLVLFRYCEQQTFWHAFEIGPTVETLYKKNRKLHDMFVLFLKNFLHYTGMEPWWGGALSYVEMEWILERIDENEWDSEEERLEAKSNIITCMEEYAKGNPYKYRHLICRQRIMAVEKLRRSISRFSKNSKLVKWMLDTCEFMELGCSVMDFHYKPNGDDDEEGIEFDLQSGLLWNINDIMTKEQEEYLEAESQGVGVMSPVKFLKLTKDRKELDFKAAEAATQWPRLLTKVYYSYNEATNQYERKN